MFISHVSFTISGHFDAREVAAKIPLQPSECKPQHSNPNGCTPVHSILKYGRQETTATLVNIEAMANQCVELIEPHLDAFVSVIKTYQPYVSLSVVPWFPESYAESTPILAFSRRVICFLAATGALIDIDTYRA